MEPKKIIIATAFIFLIAQVLSGCSAETAKTVETASESAPNLIEIAKIGQQIEKTADLELRSTRDGNSITVNVFIKNPENKAITSAETWLSFDPAKLQGKELNTDNSDFSLAAPYKNTFDNTNGLVMLGRANATPLIASSLVVGQVTFDVVQEGTTTVNIYDYQEDLSGHSSVNTLVEGQPYNLLKKPVSPALIIQ